MHRVLCLVAALSAIVALPPSVRAGPVADDEWPRYAREPRLTGRSPLHGDIATPYLSWTCSLAGRQLLLELTPGPSSTTRLIPSSHASFSKPSVVALPEPPTRDLDGSGKLRPAPDSFHERWAKILPDVPGLQTVAWSHTWTDQKVSRLRLFAYDKGFDQPRQVWQTDPPEAIIFSPLNIVYDIDGDGVQEVCVAAHYRVMIFEGTTGRKETELRYHSARPYGWFGLADLGADGWMELVTIGDFQSHIDVLGLDRNKPEGERLRVIWRRDIENDIAQRTRWPQVGPRPLADVNGDGRAEIILNIFNHTGDGQWHAVVCDAMSGNTLHDFPSRFTHGNWDVNGDGACEVFLTESDSPFVPSLGRIELVSLKGGRPRTVWISPDAGWVTAPLPCIGPTWATTASKGMKHVLLTDHDIRPAFAIWSNEDGGHVRLTVLRCDAQRQVRESWALTGLTGEAEGVAMGRLDGDDGVAMLVRARLAVGLSMELTGRGVEARVIRDEPLAAPISSPVAARLKAGASMSVVAEGAGGHVFVIDPSCPDRRQPAVAWHRPGCGMSDGNKAVGPLAVDLDGDGGNEIVIADRASRGHAALIAYHGDGSEMWRREFPQIPGGPAIWNVGAFTFWWPGRFREPHRTDLFVSTRRQLMHSDLVHLLNGHTGEVVWTRSKAVIQEGLQWGYAGFPVSVADVNSDGRDEIVNLYPVAF